MILTVIRCIQYLVLYFGVRITLRPVHTVACSDTLLILFTGAAKSICQLWPFPVLCASLRCSKKLSLHPLNTDACSGLFVFRMKRKRMAQSQRGKSFGRRRSPRKSTLRLWNEWMELAADHLISALFCKVGSERTSSPQDELIVAYASGWASFC